MTSSYTREDILVCARDWIGTPYRHQASLKGRGTDCLGLIRGIYRELEGIEPEVPPPYSADWAEAADASGQLNETMAIAARRHLREIQPETACQGDVVLFRLAPRAAAKHAAVLSGPKRMIHACSGRSVAEVSFEHWWRRRMVYAFHFPGVEN